MIVKLTEQHLEFLSFEGGRTGSSASTLVKMPHCHSLFLILLLGLIFNNIKCFYMIF